MEVDGKENKEIKMMKTMIIAVLALLSIGTIQAQTRLTLEQCLEMASQNNRTLQNAALDIEMAKEQKSEAFTKYFPQISASVMAFYSFEDLIQHDGTIPMEIAALGEQFSTFAGMPYSISELDRAYGATLSVMQPLFAGGQIRTGNKLASLQKDVMKLQLEMKEKDVMQRVQECYWQIAQMKYELQTLDAADRQLAEAQKMVGDFVSAGLTNRNDLLKVQLRQQELKSNRLKLNNAQHVMRLLLAQMVGMAGQDIDIDAALQEAQAPGTLFVESSQAVNSRAELQLAMKGAEAEQLQVKMERGKRLPSVAIGLVGMNTGLGGLSKNVRDNMETNVTNALALGTVSVPLSDWWGGSHAIKRQKIRAKQAQNDAAEAREQLQIDIEQAWSALCEAYEQVGIAQQSVEQAKENLRLVTDQYRAGTIALTDLLDAETLNRQAQTQLGNALAAYQTQRYKYEQKTR